jgi:hypothetical protein
MTPQQSQEAAALARRRLAEAHTRRRSDTAQTQRHVALPDERGHLHVVFVPEEGPAEHCRNALTILRFSIEHDEPLIGNGCPAVAVPITSLARIQARLETAIDLLDRTPESDRAEDR